MYSEVGEIKTCVGVYNLHSLKNIRHDLTEDKLYMLEIPDAFRAGALAIEVSISSLVTNGDALVARMCWSWVIRKLSSREINNLGGSHRIFYVSI